MRTSLTHRSFTTRASLFAGVAALVILAAFTLGTSAQEKNQPEAKKDPPTASGLYREFSGAMQLGNYGTKRQKKDPRRSTLDINGQHGIESMEEYFEAEVAPHIMGGTVYFAVFRNMEGGFGDAFGTGMPGGLDRHFVPGEGDPRPGDRDVPGHHSPRMDTKAKYLFLFQIVASRGLDARNQLTEVQVDKISNAIKLILGEEAKNKIKFAVGAEKTKLEKQTKEAVTNLADAVNRAMLPDDAIEDVHRVSLQLNVDPRLITSWGHFEHAGFAVNIAGQKEYVDRWGHRHKTVADGGVIPNDLIEDRTQAVSFLPGVTEMISDMDFGRVKRAAYAMGVTEGSFHVNDANVGIEKSLPYRFAQGLLDRGAEIKFASHLVAGQKKADFAVRPQRVRIIASDDRNDFAVPEYYDEDVTTSALIVDFDQQGIQKRTGAKEVRGIPRTKHSMVFGFTTNLEPVMNRRVRVDDLESTDRNKELPFSEFFSDKVAKKVPARSGYSRGHDYWSKGKKMAGFDVNQKLAFVNHLDSQIASDAGNELGFVLQPGGGGAGATGNGAGAIGQGGLGVSAPAPAAPPSGGGISGGMSSLGGSGGGSGGGGMPFGGGFPGFSRGGGSGSGGGFGGGQGGGQGDGQGTGDSNAQQAQRGALAGQQIINFQATLTNQQSQQQQQNQFQFQHQNQNQNQNQKQRDRDRHNRNRHHDCPSNGHVVPAPASLLLGLLGLPGLWLLRRRKPEEPVVA